MTMKQEKVLFMDKNTIEWRAVGGYKGLYEVSNTGLVRSIEREITYVKNGVAYKKTLKGVVLKTSPNTKGYPSVYLSKEGKRETCMVHRLVAKAFIPNPSNKPQVNHRDGNKEHNHMRNLEWNTNQENQNHAVKTGLRRVGYNCPFTRFTPEQAKWIREHYIPRHAEYSIKAMSERFGVSEHTVRRAVHGLAPYIEEPAQ
jgi:NUMOD4 motif